jgi:TonB family protein
MSFFMSEWLRTNRARRYPSVARFGFARGGGALELAQEETMFETSMVLAQPRPAGRRVGLLTVSLIAHTAAIVGAVAVSVASVDFPKDAPNESALFVQVAPPPPLGNPNGGAPPKPAAAPPVKKPDVAPPPPDQITAPADVPEETPVLDAPSTGDANVTAEDGDGRVPGPIGVPWGDPNGVGPLDAPPSPIVNVPPVEEQKIYHVAGDVKAPVLITRVDPLYPEIMRRIRMNKTVAIKGVIDRSGRVRDPEVVMGDQGPFDDAVIKAVRQWRYKPGTLNGQAVDTYLHVTVTFSIR